jgi:response regulator of citrate/malate metabolism
VCIISSEDQEETIQKAYKLGASNFLIKPVMFDDLEKALAKLGLIEAA